MNAVTITVAMLSGAAGGFLVTLGVRLGRCLTDWADEQAARPVFTAATIPAALVLLAACTCLWIVHPIRTRNRLRAARAWREKHRCPAHDLDVPRHRCGAPREGETPK